MPKISELTTATPTSDDFIIFVDNADTTTKKSPISNLPIGTGDMILATAQTVSGLKTFLNGTFGLRNIANTLTSFLSNAATVARTYTYQDRNGIIADDTDLVSKAPLAGSIAQTFSVLQLEVGHATDTTLSRESAGTLAIE